MYFARKFSTIPWVQESAAGFMYLSMRMHPKFAASSPSKLPQLYLVVQRRAQLEYGSHIVTVSVEATCQLFKPWRILKDTMEPAGPFETMPQEPWHPGKGAKLDRIIQLNWGEVRTHASYKTTRTLENFINRGNYDL